LLGKDKHRARLRRRDTSWCRVWVCAWVVDIAQRACGQRAWEIVRAYARVRARVNARERACACVCVLAQGRQRRQALRHVRRAAGTTGALFRRGQQPITHPHPPPHACGQPRLQPPAGLAPAHRTNKRAHIRGHRGRGDTRAHLATAQAEAGRRATTVATECCARTSARFWAASASARTRAVSACTKQAHVRGSTQAQGRHAPTHTQVRRQVPGAGSAVGATDHRPRAWAPGAAWTRVTRGVRKRSGSSLLEPQLHGHAHTAVEHARHSTGPHTTGGRAHRHEEGPRNPSPHTHLRICDALLQGLHLLLTVASNEVHGHTTAP
jgi:hypothetical protein